MKVVSDQGRSLGAQNSYNLPNLQLSVRLMAFLAISTLLELILNFKTNHFVELILTEFPCRYSWRCFFSRKWSYVPTPFIIGMMKGFKNSQAHKKQSEYSLGSRFD